MPLPTETAVSRSGARALPGSNSTARIRDGQRDQDFNRMRRQRDDTEYGKRERHAVPGGERGDGPEQAPITRHQQNQTEHE